MARLRKNENQSFGKNSTRKSNIPQLKLAFEDRFTTGRIFILFFLLTSLYTYPLIFRMNSSVLGKFNDFYGDIFWYLWCIWSAKVQLLELGKSPIQFDLICGPFNQTSVYALFKTHVILIPITTVFNQVVSLNVFVLLNFTLAGTFSWMMVRELTGSRTAGIVPGIAYAFCPYAYVRATEHLGLAPIWIFPLFFYVLCRLQRRFDTTGWLLLMLVLICFYLFCSPYYYLIFPLGLACWAIARVIHRFIFDFSQSERVRDPFARITRYQWISTTLAMMTLTAGAVAIYLIYLRPVATKIVRPLLWQERFALSWANYLLPGVDNPIFNTWTTDIILKDWVNRVESNTYIGWTLLLLSVFGISKTEGRRDWRVWALILFGFVGFSITLGPYLDIWGMRIPMPSLLIHKLAPFLRSIGRYSICVMVALTALAGLGMAELLKWRAGSAKSKLAIMAGLTALIAIEYAHPFVVTVVPTRVKDGPPVYARLAAKEKDATVFEFPSVSEKGMSAGDYFFYQTLHHRKLFNRYDNDTNIPDDLLFFWKDLDYTGALTDQCNLAGLKYFGVDYIVFHNRQGTIWGHGRLPDLNILDGLELTDDLGNDRIYRLTTEPAKALIKFDTREYYNYLETDLKLRDEGFEPAAVPQNSGKFACGWRLMLKKGSFEILNLTSRRLSVQLKMRAYSTEIERRIDVKVKGKNAGVFVLNPEHVRDIHLGGILISPHEKALVEFESLDGASLCDSYYRKVAGSAYFGKFELIAVEK